MLPISGECSGLGQKGEGTTDCELGRGWCWRVLQRSVGIVVRKVLAVIRGNVLRGLLSKGYA